MFLAVGLSSIGTLGYSGYRWGKAALQHSISKQLESNRVAKAYQIEKYFQGIRSHLYILAQDPMILEAMKEFKSAFQRIEISQEISALEKRSQEKKDLEIFYQERFLSKLRKGTQLLKPLEFYLPSPPQGVALQYQYLVNNPNPLGEKFRLQSQPEATGYDPIHLKYHPFFQKILETFSYYDLFLVDDASGDVVYTVMKETDFATNLMTGPYRHSGLAKAFHAVRIEASSVIRLIDFEFYEPSYNAPASFIATSLFDESGKRLGVLILQMPIDEINRVMTGNQNWSQMGLGQTGETYLVGADLKMRSISRFLLENTHEYFAFLREWAVSDFTIQCIQNFRTTTLLQEVDTVGVREALEGKTATKELESYKKVSVLSSYAPLAISDVQWGILAEIELEEAFTPIHHFAFQIALSGFVLLIVLCGLALLFTRNFIQPIYALIEGSERVSSGEKTVSIRIDNTDELGVLARTFNQMVVSLREKEEQIHREHTTRVKQLKHSEQKALEASQSKSLFLSNMSHELRTPLNAIIGFAQILSNDPSLDSTQRRTLSIILKSGEHLLELINDVLSLSKIESGKILLEAHLFSFYKFLEALEDMMQLRAKEKALKFLFQKEPGLPEFVKGDEKKLRQVLINLLSNAVKFTVEGSVCLKVYWKANRARFEVVDTGYGIREEERSKLFKPFEQTESGRNAQEGTGLGLTLSRNFVQLMGGDIEVQSTLGEGSTFAFEVDLPESREALQESKVRKVIGIAPHQKPFRILIVDDTLENRQLLQLLLSPLGFELKEATNGSEAVQYWQEWMPDLILMDLRMPVLDGASAIKQIRFQEESSGSLPCKIIVITASAFEHEKESVFQAGTNDFMTKPFRQEELFEKITQHLEVQFLYQQEKNRREEKPISVALKSEELQVLSRIFLEELYQVLFIGDRLKARQLATQFLSSVAQKPVLEKVLEMLHQFQGDELVQLLQEFLEHSKKRTTGKFYG
jgi:signal transduction histidine kinase/DNA-binding response OmpR family regulator